MPKIITTGDRKKTATSTSLGKPISPNTPPEVLGPIERRLLNLEEAVDDIVVEGDQITLINEGGGLPVIDVTSDLVDLGIAASNAVRGVEGGGDVLQDAIDWFIQNPNVYAALWLPVGTYRLTKPLLVESPVNTFCKLNMWGGSLNAFPGGATLGGAKLQLDGDGSGNELETFVLGVQGSRGCSFWGIEFVNTANYSHILTTVAGGGFTSLLFENPEREDWTAPGVRTNRYSPCAAVVVDPFFSGVPGGDEANKYPGFEDHYDTAAYSSYIQFLYCTFTGGYVGTVISPNGGGANAENIIFEHPYWVNNVYGFSQGQSQSRANEVRSPKAANNWCLFDDQEFGPGGNPGIGPMITGSPNIGNGRYVFNLSALSPIALHDGHFEGILSFGKLGTGFSGSQGGASIKNCMINFRSARNGGDDYPEVDFHFMTWGHVTFENCTIYAGNLGGPLRWWNANPGGLKIDGCRFTDATINDNVQVGFQAENTDALDLRRCQTYNPGVGPVYELDPVSNWEIIPLANNAAGVVTANGNGGEGVFPCATTAGLEVGMLVRFAANTPTSLVPQVLSTGQFGYAYMGVIGRIKSITPNTSITIENLPYSFSYGSSYRLDAISWKTGSGSEYAQAGEIVVRKKTGEAIQAAIDEIKARFDEGVPTPTRIRLVQGEYVLRNAITIPVEIQGLEILGSGWNESAGTGTTLRQYGVANTFVTEGTGTCAYLKLEGFRMLHAATSLYHIQFEHLLVNLELSRLYFNISNAAAGAILVNGQENALNYVHDCKMVGGNMTVPMIDWNGPAASNQGLNTFERLVINTPGATEPQILCRQNHLISAPAFVFRHINIEQPDGGGIHCYGISNARFEDCITSDTASQTAPVYLIDNEVAGLTPIKATFIDCFSYIDNETYPALEVRDSANSVDPGPITIIGGRFLWVKPTTGSQITMIEVQNTGYTPSGAKPPFKIGLGSIQGVRGIGGIGYNRTGSGIDRPRHLAGVGQFGGSNSRTINFTVGDPGGADPELDTNYHVKISPFADENMWPDESSKTTTSFVVRSENPNSTARFLWEMIRL